MVDHLIIPDIHNKFGIAEEIVAKHPEATDVWFLGDYFDSFEDSRFTETQNVHIAYDTAKWLKWSLSKPNRHHLFGNHDLPYVTHNTVDCPGWNHDKHKLVESILDFEDWEKIQFNGWIGDILLTHAGLSGFLQSNLHNIPYEDVRDFIDSQNLIARKRLLMDNGVISSILWSRGHERGGYEQTGGVVWCGLHEEFYPIKSIRQIFGHTCDPELHPSKRLHPAIRDNRNYCIDSYLRYYATVSNGDISIHFNDWNGSDFNFELDRNITAKWIKKYSI